MDRKPVYVKGNLFFKSLISAVMLALVAGTADAQVTTSSQSTMTGFYTMAAVEGTIWNIPDLEIDSERGLGFGARFGYNFDTNYGFSLGFDVSRISQNNNITYDFALVDMGISRIWGDQFNRFRPFLRPSFIVLFGHSIESTSDLFSNPALNNIRGSGIGGGVGSYYFISPRFSLQLSYNYSVIWIKTLRLGLNTVLEPEDNVQTHRLLFGAVIHF